jgi:hypothetical protein
VAPGSYWWSSQALGCEKAINDYHATVIMAAYPFPSPGHDPIMEETLEISKSPRYPLELIPGRLVRSLVISFVDEQNSDDHDIPMKT